MMKWKVSEAKANLSRVLSECAESPQVITKRDKPVGVVIHMKLYEELMEARRLKKTPTIAEMIDELETMENDEPGEFMIPKRENRWNPLEDLSDELAM
ncbi:MAG: type II toxin-antitoxin system Phd/YefM family antitoxin [Desulfobacterales bacterium]|nr:type II toxin-antitoxin system Phd/YefM family antitoxin [Desulfobacterales bacterium]